jgi:hypothetical protein
MRFAMIFLAGVSAFSIQAQAAWLMIGGHDFKSTSPALVAAMTSNGNVLEYANGNAAVGKVYAPIHLPVGSSITGIWCQVYDTSAVKNVTVTVDERKTYDNAGNFDADIRRMLSVATSGSPGHVKISTMALNGSGQILDWQGAPATYFSYEVTVTLNESYKTGVKACAISYN